MATATFEPALHAVAQIVKYDGAIVGVRDGSGGFSAVWQVPKVQSLSIEPEQDTDELKIGGVIEDALAVVTKLNLSLTMAGYDADALKHMLGQTIDESTGSDQYKTRIGGTCSNFPYFGLIVWGCTREADNSAGVFAIGMRKVQLSSQLSVGFSENNEFNRSDIEGMVLSDGAYAFADVRLFTTKDLWYGTDSTTGAMPTDGTTFNSFFTTDITV